MVKNGADLIGDGLMTLKQAAEFLSIGRTTLYVLMDSGKLPYVKIGKGRRVGKRALVEFAAKCQRGGWDAPP